MKIVNDLIAKLAIFSATSLVCATFIFSIYQINLFGQRAEVELSTQVKSVGSIIAEQYAAGDIAALKSTLTTAAESQGWIAGILIDSNSTVIWSRNSQPSKNEISYLENKIWRIYLLVLSGNFDDRFDISINQEVNVTNNFMVGKLSASKNIYPQWQGHFSNLSITVFVFFILWSLYLLFHWSLSIRSLKPLSSLAEDLRNQAEAVSLKLNKTSNVGEIEIIRDWFAELTSAWKAYQEKKVQNERLMVTANLASQVAHDIRSPLSALSMVIGTLKEIPEDKRILIRNATQRINDIANDLLQKGHKNHAKESFSDDGISGNEEVSGKLALTTEFIPVLIDILISEKRMQYRENTGLEIEVDLKDSFGSFAQINSNELKRVISNLINNAVEAFDDHQGRITVGVKKIPTGSANSSNSPQKVEISVKDNGRGIPKHILEKLGQMGVTHGKEGSQSGSGLGVYHAKKTAESMGGTFEIDSLEGKGTTIKIILPLAESPNWFANKIDLTAKKYLISLDDDISIHQIWAGRLSSLGLNDIEHLRFQSGEAFKHYVVSNMTKLKETLFLVDYELLNQSLTGLDIIDELGIEKYSILVTSRYEESSIQERASRLRLPILPKALAGFVPFERQQPKELFDWVLLDDDDLIKMTWEFAAKEYNKTFKYFKTPEELQTYKSKLNPEQKIFIDSNLGHGVKGEDIAQQLFAEGFKNLYLATGYAPEQFPKMDFIKAVVGKEPPGE